MLTLSLALGWMAGFGTALAQPAGTDNVTIPDFWDPNRRLDRPAAGSIAAIRFTTTDDFPPFNFIGPDGQLTGFNVDLARAICTELAIACTIQARPWDGLIDAIGAGKVDAIIAGLAITTESRAKVAFSDVYLRPSARFVAKRGTVPGTLSAETLAGRKVAVAKGSAHEAYLAAFFPKASRIPFDTPTLALEALRAGGADLVFGDGSQLAFWLQSAAAGDCCDFAGGPYLEPRFLGEGFAIALPPDKPELRHAIDWALDSLYDKGTFAELYLRYFPVGYY